MNKTQAILQIIIEARNPKQTLNGLKNAEQALKALEIENKKGVLQVLGFDFLIKGE